MSSNQRNPTFCKHAEPSCDITGRLRSILYTLERDHCRLEPTARQKQCDESGRFEDQFFVHSSRLYFFVLRSSVYGNAIDLHHDLVSRQGKTTMWYVRFKPQLSVVQQVIT